MGEAVWSTPETQNYSSLAEARAPGPGSWDWGMLGMGDVRPGTSTRGLINRSQQPNGCNSRKLKMSKPLLTMYTQNYNNIKHVSEFIIKWEKGVIKTSFLTVFIPNAPYEAHVTSHSPRNVTRHSPGMRRSRLISPRTLVSASALWSPGLGSSHPGPLSMRSGPVSARPQQRPRV